MVIAKALAGIAVHAVANRVGGKIAETDKGAIEAAIAAAIIKDPVLKNELNEEKPYQSRVAVGATSVLAGSALQLGPIADALDTLAPLVVGFVNLFGAGLSSPAPGRVAEIVGAAMIVWGAAYTLYGRFASNLKPLFSRD